MVNVVVLVMSVLADSVIDVLRRIVLVDSNSQGSKVTFASGEIVEKADVESAGFVDCGIVVVVFSEEVTILVIPAI